MEGLGILILRVVILFFLTLVLIRLIEKGNISEAAPFKLVSYIVVSVIAAVLSLGLISNITAGFVVFAIWVVLSLVVDYASLKVKWIYDLINGKETILIKNGKVMEENLKKIRYTGDDLLRELRSKNIFNLSDVEFAIMESTGDINALLKSDKKPVTPHDLQREVAPLSQPETVILDGKILDGALTNRGLNREWLRVQLSNLGVLLENVFIGQVDSSGDLFVDTFDDSMEIIQPKVKELLYASMAKVQSDLFAFSLQTENPEAKKMYSNNANTVKRMMDKLEPYLLR